MNECENLKIDTSVPAHENFLGANAVYHCYATIPDSAGRVYTDEECEVEFDRVAKVGLHIARTFYYWYAWEDGKWNWESKAMKGFYKWAAAMQKRGVDIALQAGWNSPGDINSSHWNGPSPFHVEGDWEKSVENYAAWVSESVHQIAEVRGLTNLKYLMMFTEPQHGAGKLPEGKDAYGAWFEASKAAHDRLVKDSRRHLVKMVGPDEGSTTTSDMLHWVAENGGNEFIDVYTSHNYISHSDIPEDCVHSGTFGVHMDIPVHQRGQQKVTIKPNTEYELSIWLKLSTPDKLNISGYFMYGAFGLEPGWPFFHAGTNPTTRLTLDSAAMLDAVLMSEDWKQYKITFNSEDKTEAYIGFFFNIFQTGSSVYVDDVSLKEVGSEMEILVNPGFEENDDSWMFVGEGIRSVDTYYDWSHWVQTALKYVPKGKEYWFDEYNWVLSPSKITEENTSIMLDKTRGVELAVASAAFINNGLQSSLLWTLFDQQWPNNNAHNVNNFFEGDHRWGIMPVLKRTHVPYPAYYAFSLISRYLGGGEGTKSFKGLGASNLHLAATMSPGGDVTVLVTNKRGNEADFKIDLGEFAGKKLYRRLYDPKTVNPTEKAELIGVDKEFNTNGGLSDTLPAGSFAVYSTRLD